MYHNEDSGQRTIKYLVPLSQPHPFAA